MWYNEIMSRNDPLAFYGEINFHINARSAADAIDYAINAAYNHFYANNRQSIDDDQINEIHRQSVGGDYGSCPAACDPRVSTWEEGGGSWAACVGRISYPGPRGGDKHAEYGVAHLTFITRRPWPHADGPDDVEYWQSVTKMLDEQEALTQSLPPVMPVQPVRAPRL